MRKRAALWGLTGVTLVACGGTTAGGTGDGGSNNNGDASPCIVAPAAILRQAGIDKIDILFMIDNSASMGDKQDYLKAAIPDLIKRLVQPSCVAGGHVVGQTDAMGNCAAGKPEFAPVHDMHLGVVTSSLGPRLGDACNPTEKTSAGLLKHNDDRGELINRATDDEHAEPDMQPSNFLSWFPDVAANAGKTPGRGAVPLKDLATLEKDFSDLVSGVHQLGCGIESQMESWYRFLVQPDPYDSLDNPGGRATWVGVDQTILAQRRDFLRPDSAVVIISLSDENDSEIDVRALGQQGWNWMSSGFQPPKGTSICNSNPAAPDCTSCLLAPNRGAGDPNCMAPYSAQNDWGYNLNLRHVHMKQKYGVDVQFPMQRYANGLTSAMVPNRDGEYPAGKADYVGTNNCTNPLFAGHLPGDASMGAASLCALPRGPRTPDLVFYAHIGGVPHELLHYTPGDPQGSVLSDADWTKILGRDPLHYDYTGIDPHMIESYQPRPGLPPPSSADDADPISGREWTTNATSNSVDRQFACTFPLATPRDCSLPSNADICDCPSALDTPRDQIPPVCGSIATQQIKAKAYPTIRETLLAKMLGQQGVLSSICPIDVVDTMSGNDPLFGYRPAMSALLDRVATALTNQCLPEQLPQNGASCSVLEVLPSGPCSSVPGLSDAPAPLANGLRQQSGGAIDPAASICVVPRLSGADLSGGTCTGSAKAGWCYVTGPAAGMCPQGILFSPSGNPQQGALVALQCAQAVCTQ